MGLFKFIKVVLELFNVSYVKDHLISITVKFFLNILRK